MTEAIEPSVRALLVDGGELPKTADALFESNQGFAELRTRIESGVSDLAARGLGPAALDGVLRAVDVPLSRILAGAWNGYRALRPYADPKQHPPGETALVPLVEHTIHSVHRPSVDVLVDGAKVGSIDFELRLSLELQAGLLEIQDGRIRALRAGQCRAKAKLACENAVLLERASRRIELPERYSFGAGLPIAGTAARS